MAAIGSTVLLAPELRRAFDDRDFEPMLEPGPDDWLAQHPERPQSFQDYLRADKNVPNAQRHVIYLLPVGAFPATAPPLAQLAEIVHAFATRESALAAVFRRLRIDDEAAWSASRATWIREGVRTVRDSRR